MSAIIPQTSGDYDAIEAELKELSKTYKPPRYWTPREKQILRCYYRRVPTRKLCALLSRSIEAVVTQAKLLRSAGVRFEYAKRRGGTNDST